MWLTNESTNRRSLLDLTGPLLNFIETMHIACILHVTKLQYKSIRANAQFPLHL